MIFPQMSGIVQCNLDVVFHLNMLKLFIFGSNNKGNLFELGCIELCRWKWKESTHSFIVRGAIQ